MNLFIIPGNPPAAHFYRLWKQEILSFDGKSNIEIASYPRLSIHQDSAHFLEAVHDHLLGQFKSFTTKVKGPVSIAGHSFGANFALSLCEACESDVNRCFLLHPFLRRPDFKARQILASVHALRKMGRLENLLLRGQTLIANAIPEAAALSEEEIRTCIPLAFHEHQTISKNRTPIDIGEHLRPKLAFYSCPNDIWCPAYVIEALKSQIGHVHGGASHSFIIDKDERTLIYNFLRNTCNIR